MSVRYQPLDVGMVQQRIIPFVLGMGDIDDLAADVLRLEQTRSLLRQWLEPVWVDLFNEGGEEMGTGRPFFVTGFDPWQIAETVEAYRLAGPKGLLDILREEVKKLDPSLAGQITPISPPPVVRPDATALEKALGDDYWSLGIFRSAGVAFLQGEEFRHPKYLPFHFEDAVLKFNESLQPYWSPEWGHADVSSSRAAEEHPGLFAERSDVFAPLIERIPEWSEFFAERHYVEGMGAIVFPEKVPLLRAQVASLVETPDLSDSAHSRESLRLLLEALVYTERRGLAFTERISSS